MTPDKNYRIKGLDTLRFFLALWVVIAHAKLMPLGVNEATLPGKLITGFYNNLFSGQAAVIVFFVISGFCIHYPFRHATKISLLPYFARRHTRIWMPIAVAVLFGWRLNVEFSFFTDSILWSLVCEEIYYLIYPALLQLKNKFTWKPVLIAAYIAAACVFLTNPGGGNYPSYGWTMNWILGLPCWLLGCLLAENTDRLRELPGEVKIWHWRIAAWALSSFCAVLRFHSPVKYPITLTLFGVFAFFWIRSEIVYYMNRNPNQTFENLGRGSYSIYLAHIIGMALFAMLFAAEMPDMLKLVLRYSFILLVCYVFYILIEKPSHSLARLIGNRLTSLLDSRK
jgi:peptidoglycan/LPS O-acetylase OafA/YrhL